MTDTALRLIVPLEAPLPPPPGGEALTLSQWTTLLAIADAMIPAISKSSGKSQEQLTLGSAEYDELVRRLSARIPDDSPESIAHGFLAENPSSLPAFRDSLQRLFSDYMSNDALKGIRVILSTLDTRPGCLLLTGSTTLFHHQPIKVRQQILEGWSRSSLQTFRGAARAFKQFFSTTYLRSSGCLYSVVGFPRAPIHGRPGKGYGFQFLQFNTETDNELVVNTDVIVVGSGCGGGVCAKNIAEAGHRVLVVEKGRYWSPEYLPMSEQEAGPHLFENGGAIASDDGTIVVICGSTWGGGGTVNWSASLQTPAAVRDEWAKAGLPFFTSSAFQSSLDRVCERMGVSTKFIDHNINNQILGEGARKLGYTHKDVPQNTGGKKHFCGYCSMGCGAAEKQGPVVSFLPDAACAGANFIEQYDARQVVFEQNALGAKVATGIRGTWKSSGGDEREVLVKAKRVILSGGTMNSPLLLLRSDLKNQHIGRNLHLHPATTVISHHPNRSTAINPWEGSILTKVVTEFENQDGNHHGVKLEAMFMLPSMGMGYMTFSDGVEYKELVSKFPNIAEHIILVRDRDTGRVYPDPITGKARFEYTPSAFDRKHGLVGLIALAKIAYVGGAQEIKISNLGIPTFTRSTESEPGENDPNDPHFQAWLDKAREVYNKSAAIDTFWGSAHQMGSCRMSSDPSRGVVDPKGKVWGTEGLYVADASVFPSASGVNPMITTMGIADWISSNIAADLTAERA